MATMAANTNDEKISQLLKYYPHDPKHSNVAIGQLQHRLDIVPGWNIAPGFKILEIGCGQGDCTIALADAVGPDGQVTAVDPADLSYGSPYTLGQAQSYISNSEIGSRIKFEQADPLKFLASNPDLKFDAAVLFHCIWYFPAPETLAETLSALRGRVQRVLIAEYALNATLPAAIPHVLAAIAQGSLRDSKHNAEANIRTLVAPASIKQIAEEAGGWKVKSEGTLVPNEKMFDGSWEVGGTLAKDSTVVKTASGELPGDDKRMHVIKAQLEATKAALIHAGGTSKGVRTMDVWFAEFVQ